MKRTTVYADKDDLAILKGAAARRGTAEAELIRDAIHLQAMANRAWAEPFFTRTYAAERESAPSRVGDVLDDAWAQKAAAYERTRDARG